MRQENANYTVDSEPHLVQGPGGGARHLHHHRLPEPVPAADDRRDAATGVRRRPEDHPQPRAAAAHPVLADLRHADRPARAGRRRDAAAGIPVTLTGPDASSATTNAQGCAIFQFLTPGSYTATINSPGYVEETLSQRRDMSVTVSPGQISSTPIQRYDRVGQIAPITSNNGANAMTASGVTISNGSIPNPSTRTYAGTSADRPVPVPGFAVQGLGRPLRAQQSGHLGADLLHGQRRHLRPRTVTAGGAIAASVREPPIRVDLRLTRANGQTTGAPQFYVRQMDTGCNTSKHFYDNTSTTSPPFTVPGTNNALTNSRSARSLARTRTAATGSARPSRSPAAPAPTARTPSRPRRPASSPTRPSTGDGAVLTINTSTGTPTTCATRWAAITALAAP